MLWLLAAAVGLYADQGAAAPIIREEGAVYLEEAAPQLRIKLDVKEPVAIFADVAGTRHLGVLIAPQQVELVAVSDRMLRVRGQARQGQVVGWVVPSFLSPLPPDFLRSLRQAEQRRLQVADLIARREVAVGMTQEEVRQSLGRPQKTSSRVNQDSVVEIWEFITYQMVPQQIETRDRWGFPLWQTVNVRIPTGRAVVTFQGGVVTEFTRDEENRPPRPGVRWTTPVEVF